MTDATTLVERLRNPSFAPGHVGTDDKPVLNVERTVADMREAADRIEYLERMAGAVTPGESFRDLRKQAKATG